MADTTIVNYRMQCAGEVLSLVYDTRKNMEYVFMNICILNFVLFLMMILLIIKRR